MATDLTSSLRAFAFKTLEEAKQRGASLATVQAATASLADATAASLSRLSASSSTSSALGVFRTQQVDPQPQPSSGGHDAAATLRLKLQQLERAEEAARTAVAAGVADALGESVYKMDLVNESLAFTIENVQECAHVMALLNRQLRDCAAMQTPAHRDFYRRRVDTVTEAGDKEETADE